VEERGHKEDERGEIQPHHTPPLTHTHITHIHSLTPQKNFWYMYGIVDMSSNTAKSQVREDSSYRAFPGVPYNPYVFANTLCAHGQLSSGQDRLRVLGAYLHETTDIKHAESRPRLANTRKCRGY